MKVISIQELHAKTGDWVRRCVTHGPIAVTDDGKVIAQIVPVASRPVANPFATRKLRQGYARLMGKLTGDTDSTQSVSEDRDRA